MGQIRIDEQQWPIYVVEFDGDLDAHQFGDYLDTLYAHMERARDEGIKTCMVFDATLGGRVSAEIRAMQGEWIKAHFEMCRLTNCGYAYVLPSPILRGVLTAILWIVSLPAPHTVTATRAEALRWADERLQLERDARPIGARRR